MKNKSCGEKKHAKCAGFTLVELSIVLVIIGLIIGGVLTGQQIIQNARVTNTLNGLQAYQAQFQTYVQNYGALPGDDPNATTRFPNAGVTANGNGDGVLVAFTNNGTTTNENLVAWSHLRAAGLVRNQVTSGGDTAINPPNPFNGVYSLSNGAFGATGFSTTVLCLDQVPSSAAQAIDSRLDDGEPDSGIVRAASSLTATAPAASYGTTAVLAMCYQM